VVRTSSYRPTDQTCAHSASFFKLNHFFSFGFSVLSGSGGVLEGLWFASQLPRVEFRDQVAASPRAWLGTPNNLVKSPC